MKASNITEGDRYIVAVHIAAGPRTPRMRATKEATVVAVERSTVTIEVTEPVCVNLDEHAEDPGWAMVDGLLRWEHRPVTRTIRASEVLARIDSAVTP